MPENESGTSGRRRRRCWTLGDRRRRRLWGSRIRVWSGAVTAKEDVELASRRIDGETATLRASELAETAQAYVAGGRAGPGACDVARGWRVGASIDLDRRLARSGAVAAFLAETAVRRPASSARPGERDARDEHHERGDLPGRRRRRCWLRPHGRGELSTCHGRINQDAS